LVFRTQNYKAGAQSFCAQLVDFIFSL